MATEFDDFHQVLEQLGDETKPFTFSRLYVLSDLHREQLEQFFTAWDGVSKERRRRLVLSLVELAEASFEVNFDAIFRRCLDDPDHKVRAAAIDGLWENESPALIGPFLTMLRHDPSAQVRAAAASGLGHYVLAGELEELEPAVQDRIVLELLTLFHTEGESSEVRRRAIESAAYACTPEVLEALELAYSDEREKMRLSAVLGMGRSCSRQWRPILLRELGNPSSAMRYEAAHACGELMLRQAVPKLSRLIHDPDREVCNAAIWALGEIGGEPARQALLAAFDGADEDTQAAIDDALAEQALLSDDADFLLFGMEGEPGEDMSEFEEDTGEEENEQSDRPGWDNPASGVL